MKCSSCGEQNDSGMQFCINCGQTLAAASAPPAPQPMMTEEQLSMSHQNMSAVQPMPMVLLCTVCNKTDPLNGQFCVFCGGKTVAGPAPRIQNYQTAPMPTPVMSPEFSHLSMEVPRVNTKPSNKKSQGGGAGAIVALLLAMIIGAAAGFGGIMPVRDAIEQQALQRWWPADALLVYSTVPNGKVRLEDIKHKNLIFGSTSPDGTFVLNNLQSGAYTLNLSDGKGKELTQDFRISTGEPLILGYPQRLKLDK